MSTKKFTITPYLMFLFALIGVADALYVSHAVHTGQLLWCPPPIDGCNTVASSPHARIFGVPLANLGLVFYLFMCAFSALLAYDPISRGLRLGTLAYASLGVLSLTYFTYLQVAVIRAFCFYCLISALLTLLIFVASLTHFRATRR